jgi:hypothetical protein
MAKTGGALEYYKAYSYRAEQYKNLFDPSTKFFRAKNNDTWYTPFDPFEVNFNYTEANAWQYRFAAPQDISGMMRLMGGREAFAAKLDTLFTVNNATSGRNQADITGLIGQYVHGNEPSHHMAYLYNYAGQPSKTQLRVRQILDEMYHNRPDGLSGNEDCGQMSAWYVLSAMGFYQVAPGDPTYTLGSPLFDKVTIHQSNGKDFVLQAPGASSKNRYFKRLTFNDKEWSKTWITHDMITSGGTLSFEMSDAPATWGSAERDCPMTAIIDEQLLPIPFIAKGARVFRGSQTVTLDCLDKTAEIWYAFQSDTDYKGILEKKKKRYEGPITLEKGGNLMLWCQKDNRNSQVNIANFSKIPDNLHVLRYNTKYNAQYTARGDEGLIDGIRGSRHDFRTGDWQGFEGVNLDLVIDLGKTQKIKSVTAGFIQDQNAWIFFPTRMDVEISDDGEHFEFAGSILNLEPQTTTAPVQRDFQIPLKGKKGRYVRIIGVTPGKCPEWHKGKGYPCWVFADEVGIE